MVFWWKFIEMKKDRVSIVNDSSLSYPKYPYLPDDTYQELESNNRKIDKSNKLYGSIRSLLYGLDLDRKNYGKDNWNPFGTLVKPGGMVVIKPNWVSHKSNNGCSIDALITDTSIIKPIIDYLLIALKDCGSIVLADAPIQGCDFRKLKRKSKIDILIKKYRKNYPRVSFSVMDLRKIILRKIKKNNIGDLNGYYLVNLKNKSLLSDKNINYKDFRVSMYDYRLMLKHHNLINHEYLISKTIMDADLIVNIPKMKCHVKAGLTGALKNVVGINGNKEYLPHYIKGSPKEGGDQYIYSSRFKDIYNYFYDKYWIFGNKLNFFCLRSSEFLCRIFCWDNLFDGGWSGNDTIPRTIIDLNNILYFYDEKNKRMGKKQRRKIISIVDGVIAGEGMGPLSPIPKNVGILIGGFNPLMVDTVMAILIGYGPKSIKTLKYGFDNKKSMFKTEYNLKNIKIKINAKSSDILSIPNLNFKKPKYWEKITY
jgi:uncharacterized protein (DUF362 family)